MSDFDNLTREDVLQEIDNSWKDLLDFIDSLTGEQFTKLTDAAGWTVKDHAIHIAMWENASVGMLEGKSIREILNITPEVWKQGDDPINAVLQERYHDMPSDEVMQTLEQYHNKMLNKLNSMTEADLQLSYNHYQPESSSERRIMDFFFWDTVEHYRDHLSWMKAIAEKE